MDGLASWDQTLTTLVRTRGAELKRYGFLLCGNSAEAEDLVQDALVRTFTFAGRGEIAEVERYVRKIMLHLFIDRARRRQIWQRLIPLVAVPLIATPDHEEMDGSSNLRRALMRLTARQRACVVLHYYLDQPVAEIGEQLGISGGSVKRHLFEARARLASQLRGTSPTTTEDGYATR